MKNSRDTGTRKRWRYAKGITHFDKKTERMFFFILTMIALLWGLLTKAGLLPG